MAKVPTGILIYCEETPLPYLWWGVLLAMCSQDRWYSHMFPVHRRTANGGIAFNFHIAKATPAGLAVKTAIDSNINLRASQTASFQSRQWMRGGT